MYATVRRYEGIQRSQRGPYPPTTPGGRYERVRRGGRVRKPTPKWVRRGPRSPDQGRTLTQRLRWMPRSGTSTGTSTSTD